MCIDLQQLVTMPYKEEGNVTIDITNYNNSGKYLQTNLKIYCFRLAFPAMQLHEM